MIDGEHEHVVTHDLLPAETRSPHATISLGRRLASRLKPGDVVALYGDLGAGKTILVRGICQELGVDPQDVTSPTFTILHEYTGGAMPVYHFDAYRIERVEEFFELGFEEYFFGDGVTVIEWAERVETLLPKTAVRIHLAHEGADLRRISRAGESPAVSSSRGRGEGDR